MMALALMRHATASLASLLVVSWLLFAAAEVLPGDAVTASLGSHQTPAATAALRERLDLDRGAVTRYVTWLGAAAQGDLGTSVQTERPVRSMLAPAVGATATLTGFAWLLAAALALVLGITAGLRPGSRRDTAISTAALGALAVPEMAWAVVLIALFASTLHSLPAVSLVPAGGTPLDDPAILILPAACLVLTGAAWATRTIRATVADQAAAPHVEAARLAGLPTRTVVRRHVLPGAVGPCAQTLAWLAALMVGGTAIVERAFDYPGITQLLVAAVHAHDVPVIEATGLLLAGVVIVALLLADAVALAADPRIRGRS